MIPHTLVLEPGLVIYKIYNGYWFWGRTSTEDLHEVMRKKMHFGVVGIEHVVVTVMVGVTC